MNYGKTRKIKNVTSMNSMNGKNRFSNRNNISDFMNIKLFRIKWDHHDILLYKILFYLIEIK